ncbi:hypothetical protein QBC32DRAFT_352884 [Pseudoneurospora amorphoporcata]|uniref:Uncharacterized protein n=1 Tax=Pseudoneurospora amorphoporcata TaxID=241081 RepID=A0AAN6NMQ8_9PEZI|nr:hypothetical protein QBC32DRAFT_352884 [Pseudoneurospora amorphoporcata]
MAHNHSHDHYHRQNDGEVDPKNCWPRNGCTVKRKQLSEIYPNLTVRPRPEPQSNDNDHDKWSNEYEQWGPLRCPCGNGYFCREHGDWIPGDEVGPGKAVPADQQRQGACPSSHYEEDCSGRENYVGRRDAIEI